MMFEFYQECSLWQVIVTYSTTNPLSNVSDEAIAAFLEASGQSLTELSLNSIKKVWHELPF